MIDLDPNENVILKVRRHKLALILESTFLVIFIVLPPAVYYLINIFGYLVQAGGDQFSLFLFAYSAVLLFGWIIFFKIWTDYYLDVLIVTDKRLIDIEQKGFFKRDVATLRLDKIQDIRVNVSGVLATFLDFGEISIQTAGESKEFIMRYVPEPSKVKGVIYDLCRKLAEAPQSVKVVE